MRLPVDHLTRISNTGEAPCKTWIQENVEGSLQTWQEEQTQRGNKCAQTCDVLHIDAANKKHVWVCMGMYERACMYAATLKLSMHCVALCPFCDQSNFACNVRGQSGKKRKKWDLQQQIEQR